MVREQMPLIEGCGREEWWQDVTVPMLETARKRLRLLIKLIEKVHRKPVYTDFEDQMGRRRPSSCRSSECGGPDRFVAKARQFLRRTRTTSRFRLRLNSRYSIGPSGNSNG